MDEQPDPTPDQPRAANGPERRQEPVSAVPPLGARIAAFAAICIAGVCGGLIGYAFTDLQCQGNCAVPNGLGGLVGALISAVGVAIVAVLALRAMGEWQTVRERDRGAPPP
jgi:hypothetical protein